MVSHRIKRAIKGPGHCSDLKEHNATVCLKIAGSIMEPYVKKQVAFILTPDGG
jgi:hypothetical protein